MIRPPPPPVLLEELLATWTSNYVMHSQRVAHASATGGEVLGEDWSEGAAPADGTTHKDGVDPNNGQPLQLATANGPRIELF